MDRSKTYIDGLAKKVYKMIAIILAGRFGTRLRCITEVTLSNTFYDIYILINQLISNKMKVLKYEISEYCLKLVNSMIIKRLRLTTKTYFNKAD